MLQHGKLITGFSFLREAVGGVGAQIADVAVTQRVQIVRGVAGGGEVIVVDVDGLALHLSGGTHHDIQDALLHKVFHNRIILFGIQQDEAIGLTAGNLRLNDAQSFFCIIAGDQGDAHTAGIAELGNAADGLGIEGVFVVGGSAGRINHTDEVQTGMQLAVDGGGGFVAQFGHGPADPVGGFLTDGGVVVANSGDRGRGDPCKGGNVFDCDCHVEELLCIKMKFFLL